MQALTRAEIGGSIATGAELASFGSLPDPMNWTDLDSEKEPAIKVVQKRLAEDRTPLVSQVIRWPKETGGWRPMAWLDPLDQIIFRGVVGRLIPGIQKHLDNDVVLSSRLEDWPPNWRLEHWGTQTAERRKRGLSLLEELPVLGLIDIKRFYPSIDLKTLERVFDRFTLDSKTFAFLLAWLQQLDQTYGARGLPTGHDPSRLLADGFLLDCDRTLTAAGIPFLRYVDDTWFFIERVDAFDPVVTRYSEALETIGLEIQPLKTKPLTGADATNEIQNFAIAYLGDELSNPGPEGLEASLELFEYAMGDLPERKAELRRSITALQSHMSLEPLSALREDIELLRYAPGYWSRYLRTLTNQKHTRKALDDDWMVEQAKSSWSSKDDMYKTLVFLQAMSRIQLGPDQGRLIGELTHSTEGWLAPVRVWGAHIWGASEAYSPDEAVEIIEASGDYSTRRSLALTLDNRRGHKKHTTWLGRIKRLDSELEPTARWLEN